MSETEEIVEDGEVFPKVLDNQNVGRRSLLPILEKCMEHPGLWHEVRVYKSASAANQAAYQLKNKRLSRPSGAWEFCSRKGTLLAKFLGEEQCSTPSSSA